MLAILLKQRYIYWIHDPELIRFVRVEILILVLSMPSEVTNLVLGTSLKHSCLVEWTLDHDCSPWLFTATLADTQGG